MFVTIKYGDDQKLVVNADCLVSHLLRYIQQKCCPDNDGNLDVADEIGHLKNIRLAPSEYAQTHFTERESLILLRFPLDSDPNQQVTPLLVSKLKDDQFMATLNQKKKSSSKKSFSSESKAAHRATASRAGGNTSDDGKKSGAKKNGVAGKSGSRMSTASSLR